jgi:hypothetical protein
LFQDLTHPVLQYADDTLIIVKADAAQLSCLKDILDQFSSYTGLSINFDKSTFVPIGIHHDTSRILAAIFGCPIACFPQTYLGLPLTATKLKQSELQSIIRAVEGYIPRWCGKAVTPSGRTVLVNVVLSAHVVYPMCSLLLLTGIIEAIDKKRRAFLWTGDASCNGGQCKVAWTTVCLDKPQGGLGVKDLSKQNKGLLAKFLAKLHQEPTSSWQKWFHRLYGRGAGRDLGDKHYLVPLLGGPF